MGTHKENALTDAIITKARKKKGAFKLTDGNGLVITFNNPNGTPTWCMMFRRDKEYIRAILGKWPAMSLEQARAACTKARNEWLAKNKMGAVPIAKPETQSTLRIKVATMSQQTVFAAAGAAMELVESFGFAWNGARWVYG